MTYISPIYLPGSAWVQVRSSFSVGVKVLKSAGVMVVAVRGRFYSPDFFVGPPWGTTMIHE